MQCFMSYDERLYTENRWGATYLGIQYSVKDKWANTTQLSRYATDTSPPNYQNPVLP